LYNSYKENTHTEMREKGEGEYIELSVLMLTPEKQALCISNAPETN